VLNITIFVVLTLSVKHNNICYIFKFNTHCTKLNTPYKYYCQILLKLFTKYFLNRLFFKKKSKNSELCSKHYQVLSVTVHQQWFVGTTVVDGHALTAVLPINHY
jgi:hypothetical protein